MKNGWVVISVSLVLTLLTMCSQSILVQCLDGSTAHSGEECSAPSKPEITGALIGIPVEDKTVVSTEELLVVDVISSTGTSVMDDLLIKVPSRYWFSYAKDRDQFSVLVVGSKRANGLYRYLDPENDVLLWDVDAKTAYVGVGQAKKDLWEQYTGKNIQSDSVIIPVFVKIDLTGDQRIDDAIIPDRIKNRVEEFYVPSPTDMMKLYARARPVNSGRQKQLIRLPGGAVVDTELSIEYKNKDMSTETVKFWFGTKYSVPVMIERLDKEGVVFEKTRYEFDTFYRKGKDSLVIKDEMAELPKERIIISAQEYEKVKDVREIWLQNRK